MGGLERLGAVLAKFSDQRGRMGLREVGLQQKTYEEARGGMKRGGKNTKSRGGPTEKGPMRREKKWIAKVQPS